MNRFNLTFSGEIIAGHDPAQARIRLAEILGIEDPQQLQGYFLGDPVVLRRNLERKEAAELYAKLRRIGIHAELVTFSDRGMPQGGGKAAPSATPATAQATAPVPASPAASSPAPAPAQKPAPATKTGAAPAGTQATEIAIRKADLAAEKSLKAEDVALLKAKERALQKALRAKEKEQARRDKAGERAREQTQARETLHKAKLEAARRKAEQDEEKRLSETAAAARKQEQEQEQERQRAEVAAQRKAALEQQRAQKAAAEAAAQAEHARREAEERARQAAAQAERARKAAAEQARLAAERAEKARQEQLRQAEQQRLAAEKAALKAAEKRKAEQLAAMVQVENARRKRERAAEAARRRAEEVRKRAEEQARIKAEQDEQQAQRRAMEEQAIQRGAAELAQKPSLKPVDARVRTRLEMPRLLRRSGTDTAEHKRKRQPGEPNLYSLRPFRNTPEIRARAEQSQRMVRWAVIAASIACACTVVLFARLLTLPPQAGPSGASAIVIAPQEGPLLLAGQHLLRHDRAGVGEADLSFGQLGVVALQGPMAFDRDGDLLATGLLEHKRPSADEPHALQLLRCRLADSRCDVFSRELAGTVISGLAVHPLDGNLFIADASAGRLLKVSPDGAVLARADAALPARPVLRLDNGLLLINSALGPAISVFRYEDAAFGQQLDEILLLPSSGAAPAIANARDFLFNGEHWWVLANHADTDTAGLYRFDAQWQFVEALALAPDGHPEQLVAWGNRTLVGDSSRIPIQRFNATGQPESPFASGLLAGLAEEQQHGANLSLLGWRSALALALLALVASCCVAALHRVRSLVYKSCKEHGAAPIDKLTDSIEWVSYASDRSSRLARTGVAYAALAAGLVLSAVGLGVSALHLSALLLLLAGPAAALLLLQRSDPGHIGTVGEQLLLVDHEGLYHLGSGGQIHFRGPFLMIDDVTVFSGTRLLPGFAAEQVNARIAPLATGGVKVDRKIVTVKLLQGRHPLALGAVAIATTTASAVALLSLQGIF